MLKTKPVVIKNKQKTERSLAFLARQSSGLGQQDFAKTYCISLGTLQTHEQKKREPTELFLTYYRLIGCFPVEIAELVTQTPDKEVSRSGMPMYCRLLMRFPKEMETLTKKISN